VLRCPVERIERTQQGHFRLVTGGEAPGAITCANLVLCAGLHVSKLAATLAYGGEYRPPETFYAKGQYYALSGRSPFKRHIYPLPDGAWLGLHATVDIGGRCKFGPDIEWIPGLDYSFVPEKLDKFLDFVRSYYPGLDATRLHPDYTGISTWMLSVYTASRLKGRTDAEAKQAVEGAIRQSEEWRLKHPDQR